jgi:sugar lactone lactonase YvrE
VRWGIKFVLLASLLGLVLPGSALGFGALSSFGELGGGPGQLDSPKQLAVAADGDVYVADSGNGRISVFTGNGSFVRSFGEGELSEPMDVALDGGRVLVADAVRERVVIFDTFGKFLDVFDCFCGPSRPSGLAVDSSSFSSTVYVADAEGERIVAFSAGSHTQIEPPPPFSPRDLIVGSDGDLYVADSGNERVDVFTKGGAFVRSFGETGAGALSDPVALALDGSGGIYVADQTADRVEHFSEAGGFLGGFTAEPDVAGVVAACGGNVFVAEESASLARVVRFGEAGTPPPPCTPPEQELIVDPGVKLPSNKFHFAGLRKNRANGFAMLFVRVPGPGKVSLTGRGFRRLSRTARQATTVSIPIKPKVRLRHFLKQHGKGRIRVEVTFTPAGGEPREREKVIVLKLRRRG